MKHCPSHGAEQLYEGGDVSNEEEELLDMLERYVVAHKAMREAQEEIDAWVGSFVGMKEGDILEEGVSFNELFCAAPVFHMRDGFTGWRGGRKRARVLSFTSITNSRAGYEPVLQVIARCVPLKSDDAEMNSFCNATLDLNQAIHVNPNTSGFNDLVMWYVGKVIERRAKKCT
jgi:hypothetical protein